jgi:predicted negative regulator of RcsB-dependent stress response
MSDNKELNRSHSLEEKLSQWFYNNRLLMIVAPVIIIVAALAYGGITYFKTESEKKAQADLFRVKSAIEKKMEAIAKDEEKNRTEFEEKNKKTKLKYVAAEKTPAALDEKLKIEIADLSRIVEQYKGSNASPMAAIDLANIATEYKNWEMAENSLKKVINDLSKNSLYFPLVYGQLAFVLSENNKCKEALPYYDTILANKTHSSFHAQALLRKGVCHYQLSEWDPAEKAFNEIEKNHSQTSSVYSAKNFKRLIALKKGK